MKDIQLFPSKELSCCRYVIDDKYEYIKKFNKTNTEAQFLYMVDKGRKEVEMEHKKRDFNNKKLTAFEKLYKVSKDPYKAYMNLMGPK